MASGFGATLTFQQKKKTKGFFKQRHRGLGGGSGTLVYLLPPSHALSLSPSLAPPLVVL